MKALTNNRILLQALKSFLAMFIALVFISLASQPVNANLHIHDKKFANCASLNKVYSGGVAKSSKWVNKGGKLNKVPVVNPKVYNENTSRDRDKDGIACEN